jgi:transcription-repair coupling factor (superfamily II helicase)
VFEPLLGLSSVGLADENNNVSIPLWFVDKKPLQEKGGERPVPLELGNISRGDYLVHRDHGVGVCVGLALKEGGASAQELLSIKYNDGGIISTDIGSLDLIAFFAPAGTEGVVLDSLSKKGNWTRKKMSAKKRAEEIIQHLLNLYVKRRGLSRPAFSQDPSLEGPFLASFPFEETPDQVSAWNNISEDLSANSPMDRLLCGDVGFGKTELAIRAAFRVVMAGKRVVVLSPTTILANQLRSSFSARLEPGAISVDMVSRFRSQKDLRAVKNNIIENNNDVLIGTHAVLNDDLYLKNMGLLIVDEEHRFGVKHKERIRLFKSCVDVLSMSATPIPRSMNLALSGIYSVSMLQTPPRLRLPIITRVEHYNDLTIRTAIGFEVGRGGQVYFVHNDILSIKNITERIRGLFPLLQVMFIHGQESPSEVERKMGLFISATVSVLVCTSIIEAGIDVPNANCIIINNSHLFGLSQLYQIRGRVGRSHRQAYAYLVIPQRLTLSTKAFYRIKTIEENTRLGSGYIIPRSEACIFLNCFYSVKSLS